MYTYSTLPAAIRGIGEASKRGVCNQANCFGKWQIAITGPLSQVCMAADVIQTNFKVKMSEPKTINFNIIIHSSARRC